MIRTKNPIFILFLGIIACTSNKVSKEITHLDRKTILARHEIVNTGFDTLSSLSIGNGKFAVTVDASGLQTFPEYYKNGVPLGCLSEWAWHSNPNVNDYKLEETFKIFETAKGNVPYAIQKQTNPREKAATNFLRENPHRIHLGNFGFEISLSTGKIASIDDYKNVKQSLDLYTGTIFTQFEIEGEKVNVETLADQVGDGLLIDIKSPLLDKNRIAFSMRYASPESTWKVVGTHFQKSENEKLNLDKNSGKTILISRDLNSFSYLSQIRCDHELSVSTRTDNGFDIIPLGKASELKIKINYCKELSVSESLDFDSCIGQSKNKTKQFWEKTAIIDVTGSSNPMAQEFERRFILSKYLVYIQSGGKYPPQETGLTYNSWYGRPHLEMFYWHILGQTLCGDTDRLDQQLKWYNSILPEAKKLASRQGYAGARWLKMTDPSGQEGPSSVGAFLIWQQPHPIYLSNLLYQVNHDTTILNRFKEIVFETAEFMADFAVYENTLGHYKLGPPLIAAQERFGPDTTFNTGFEVEYWKTGLSLAIQWKKILGQEVPNKWEKVLAGMPELVVSEGKYLIAESAQDSYSNAAYRTDHPMVLGVNGLLNAKVDAKVMNETYDWIQKNWVWEQTWGWDYPMVAMSATALGRPQDAINALLMRVQKNTYLKNGHNFQDARLTLYLPGNSGYLAAVAKMCSIKEGKGFPQDGTWKVVHEGFLSFIND